jgi:predicted ATPase with chaperone activity
MLLLGEVLIAKGLITPDHVMAALERQLTAGGPIGENLVALGVLTQSDLDETLSHVPKAPKDLKSTGLNEQLVLNLMIKLMHFQALETPSDISEAIKLPVNIVIPLLEFARDAKLVQVLGASGVSMLAELRYGLTGLGDQRARNAMAISQYLGPAPVTLDAYCAQIEQQHLANERLSEGQLREKFSHLVLPKNLLEKIGPAANSTRAMLLYGPPGSGKTSIANSIGKAFRALIYVPYAFEVDGQIVIVFDPTVHVPVRSSLVLDPNAPATKSIMRGAYDERWVPCHRPFITAGGELTLEMLNLGYNADAVVYEAPLQIKAMNGIFLIDDFGRQLVDPRDLLNRWIVPLEKRFDYLSLATGRKFLVPFDVLVVFSTNLAPQDLMDDAFLRRIPYKIYVGAPSETDYREIFRRVCAHFKLDLPNGLIDRMLKDLYKAQDRAIASYHPKFLIDRVMDCCRYLGEKPELKWEYLLTAWQNLFVEKAEKSPPPQD